MDSHAVDSSLIPAVISTSFLWYRNEHITTIASSLQDFHFM